MTMEAKQLKTELETMADFMDRVSRWEYYKDSFEKDSEIHRAVYNFDMAIHCLKVSAIWAKRIIRAEYIYGMLLLKSLNKHLNK